MKISVLLSIAVLITAGAAADADLASQQLSKFKNSTNGHIAFLTTSNGGLVESKDTTSWYNNELIDNEYLMEILNHEVEENIPDRIVHAKGAGAFGYFQVTHNVTDICSAAFFDSIGKKTPVLVRFSPASGHKGESETRFGGRGFAVKFYTEEGNFDIAGFNTPMLFLTDPILFPSSSRTFKRNPVTNFRDPNMMWDLIASQPIFLNFILYLFGDNGAPDGYRHMPGFSAHTYQLYNKFGESYFARFSFHPDRGIKNLLLEEANKISCSDPDYAGRDLYNAIEKRDYPSWTVKLQVLSLKDVKECKFDPFDITRTLSYDKYPLRTLGSLVLNRNPTNHFADLEQAAFCPGNLVRGILGAPDLVFKARRHVYKAAQRYRLGANFQQILVNQPLNKVHTYNRDGVAPVGKNGGGAPNYYPNSYNGPEPYVDKNKPSLIKIKQTDNSYNLEEVTERFIKLSADERQRLVGNIVASLSLASKIIQERVVDLFKSVHQTLALETMAALTNSSVPNQ